MDIVCRKMAVWRWQTMLVLCFISLVFCLIIRCIFDFNNMTGLIQMISLAHDPGVHIDGVWLYNIIYLQTMLFTWSWYHRQTLGLLIKVKTVWPDQSFQNEIQSNLLREITQNVKFSGYFTNIEPQGTLFTEEVLTHLLLERGFIACDFKVAVQHSSMLVYCT